jgi:hypothetical protein
LVSLGLANLWPWQMERQLSAYTDHWNDISFMRLDLQKDGYTIDNIMSSPKVLNTQDRWDRSLLIVAGVEKPYTKEEIASISKFLEHGGKLLLADDRGNSEPLLEQLGIELKVNTSKVYSPSYIKNPDFIELSGYIDSGPVSNTDYTVLSDKPATFEGSVPGTIFLTTDNDSWIDTNHNKERELSEPLKTYVIGFFVSGNTFLSDPSIFINDMWVRDQNAKLGRDIVRAMLPDGGKVIFDESRHVSTDSAHRAQKALYDMFIFLSFDNYARGIMVAACIIGVLFYLRYVRLPTDWRHLPNLDEPYFVNYKEGTLSQSDGLRVKVLLENKVRVSLQMSSKEFNLRKRDLMTKVLDDPDLIRFQRAWAAYKKEDLERILDKIKTLEITSPEDLDGGAS